MQLQNLDKNDHSLHFVFDSDKSSVSVSFPNFFLTDEFNGDKAEVIQQTSRDLNPVWQM